MLRLGCLRKDMLKLEPRDCLSACDLVLNFGIVNLLILLQFRFELYEFSVLWLWPGWIMFHLF